MQLAFGFFLTIPEEWGESETPILQLRESDMHGLDTQFPCDLQMTTDFDSFIFYFSTSQTPVTPWFLCEIFSLAEKVLPVRKNGLLSTGSSGIFVGMKSF